MMWISFESYTFPHSWSSSILVTASSHPALRSFCTFSPLASPPSQQPVVHWGFSGHPSSEGPIPGRRLPCLAPGTLPARPLTGHPHPLQPLQVPRLLRSGNRASPVPPEALLHGARDIGALGDPRSGQGRGWPLHSRSSSESPGTRGACRPCPPGPPALQPVRVRPPAGPLATSTAFAECGSRSPSPGRPRRRSRNDSKCNGPRGGPGERGRHRGRAGPGPGGRPSAAPGRWAGAAVAGPGRSVLQAARSELQGELWALALPLSPESWANCGRTVPAVALAWPQV